jgi:hypothetical protein
MAWRLWQTMESEWQTLTLQVIDAFNYRVRFREAKAIWVVRVSL